MSMGEIDIFGRGSRGIFQYDSRIECHIRQEGLSFQVRIVTAAAWIDHAVSHGKRSEEHTSELQSH